MLTTKRRGRKRVMNAVSVTGVKSKRKKKPVKNTKKQINSKEVYKLVMKEIDRLMKKGEANLTSFELKQLRTMAEAAEKYEDTREPLPLPEGLPDIIRMRMFQMRLNQSFAARLLGVSDAKFSLIMSGKQKPDVYFLKAIHEKMKVDAERILQAL